MNMNIDFDTFSIECNSCIQDNQEIMKHITYYNTKTYENKIKIDILNEEYNNLDSKNSSVYNYYNFIDSHKVYTLKMEIKNIVKYQRTLYKNITEYIQTYSKQNTKECTRDGSVKSVSSLSKNSNGSHSISERSVTPSIKSNTTKKSMFIRNKITNPTSFFRKAK